jgi:ABC-2 type transport system permease protein
VFRVIHVAYALFTSGGSLSSEIETQDARRPAAADRKISGGDAWNPAGKRDAFILKQLVTKDFKLKYRRSVLGVAWSVLNPLLMMIILAIVFTNMMRVTDDTIPNFPLYLIIGNTAFTMMSDSTSAGMASIIGASSLLKKVKINRWVFPVQKVLFAAVNYGFSLIAVALVMAFYQWVPSWHLIYIPLFLALFTVFCIGLSLFLSAASVFFRDVMHLWGVLLTAWTYLTPLFYSIKILPDWLQSLEKFNPMYLFVTFIRRILLWRMDPGLTLIGGCALSALLMFALGYFVFHKNEHKFILYI